MKRTKGPLQMTNEIPKQAPRDHSVAVTVVNTKLSAALCPFFAKCDGLLVVEPDTGSNEYIPHGTGDSDALCELIIHSGAKCVICGFIGDDEKRKLANRGIDVRLGSCACAVDDLVCQFQTLERA